MDSEYSLRSVARSAVARQTERVTVLRRARTWRAISSRIEAGCYDRDLWYLTRFKWTVKFRVNWRDHRSTWLSDGYSNVYQAPVYTAYIKQNSHRFVLVQMFQITCQFSPVRHDDLGKNQADHNSSQVDLATRKILILYTVNRYNICCDFMWSSLRWDFFYQARGQMNLCGRNHF